MKGANPMNPTMDDQAVALLIIVAVLALVFYYLGM
jgi:hypothetical protein